MEIIRFICIAFVFIFHIKTCVCRDRYNPSNDFLLHEAGAIPSNDKNSYNLNFPSLSPSKPTQTTLIANTNNVPATKPQPSGKRDYVAPQRPSTLPTSTSKPPINSFTNSGSSSLTPKRDYVAEFPTLKPLGTTSKHSVTTPLPSTPPKRDYVAPNLPSTNNKNTHPMTGKVKDLINFYDSKPPSGPPQKPSYSSVINGPKGNQTPTSSTVNTPKPMSFSSVVSGSNKPTSTYKATTPATAAGRPGVANSNVPTKRPGSPVLPSSIISNQGQGTNSDNPSDAELQTMSEELLRKDINNAAKYVTVNYQEKTTSLSKEDKAPLPLLIISPEVWNITTVQKFTPLLDNYERDTLVNEYVTSQERNEENAFMDVIMATSVFRHLMNFLKDKGYVTPDPKQQRDFIKQMWFGLYSRGKGKISSSGFEHVFVSELKNNEVSGLHNWIYFSKEELANRINYLGYLKYAELNGKGAVLKMHFNQQGVDKPVDSMFIGTSPELEMALYTLCFVTRADKDCKLKLGTKDVEIVTHNFRYRSKNYIGSAYPQI